MSPFSLKPNVALKCIPKFVLIMLWEGEGLWRIMTTRTCLFANTSLESGFDYVSFSVKGCEITRQLGTRESNEETASPSRKSAANRTSSQGSNF